ncbi:hypothetical protein [Candidatus Spongiihabitans sp.]|uniref:hypothetical protein n=1 Tax=Candidatus Spongiihabitans sp. TaxID=3101308 RepID=UPI003C6F6313
MRASINTYEPVYRPIGICFTRAIHYTHRFIKHLTETGFTEQQAEALADEQVRFINANLASKEDIARIEAALKTDITRVEANLKVDIAQARHEVTKWMVGVVLGVAAVQTTLIVGLLSWLLQSG